jgi:hypothetical protein
MMKRLQYAILFISFFSFFSGLAQTYNVQFYVEKAYFSGYNGDEYGPRIRLYKYDWRDETGYALWLNDNCIKLQNINTGFLDIGKTYTTTVDRRVFDLVVVTHEERKSGSDDCTSQGVSDVSTKHPDRYEDDERKSIDLNAYAPGVYSPAFVMRTESGGSYVETYIKIRYTPVVQESPAGNAGQNCSDSDYTLTTKNISAYADLTNTTGLKYIWQYAIKGEMAPNPDYQDCTRDCSKDLDDCSRSQLPQAKCEGLYDRCSKSCSRLYPESIPRWRDLSTTDDPSVTFNPLQALFKNSLTASKSVAFRVKTVGAELQNGYSDTSTPVYYEFVPPAPNATTFLTEASCPEGETGIVHVSGVTSQFAGYRYILKAGIVADLGCNPDTDGSCLSVKDRSGSASGSNFDIINVRPDTYTLFLLNNAGTAGFCPRNIGTVIVPVVPNLKTTVSSLQNLTCYAVNSGSISVATEKGRYSTIVYDLLNQTTNTAYTKSSTTENAIMVMDQLNPGSYRLTVSDGCTPAVTSTFDITQPAKIDSVEFQKTDATCLDPGNGIARVVVSRSSGTFDRSVSAMLIYRLLKGDVFYSETESSAFTYTWTGLPIGTYQIVVKEKGGEDCNGTTMNFKITGPAALGIETPVVSDVTCFNGDNGSISIKGTGGTGNYIYELSGAATLSNSSGIFTGLHAGEYIITVRNVITCNDIYEHPKVTVYQPTQVVATISKKDISCFRLTNGEITSVVSGGTPAGSGYIYTWETKIGAGWSSLSKTTSSLTGLSEGTYRLKAKDEKECPAVSNEVIIVEPAAVGISDIQVADIKCYGEKGSIAITGIGGTGTYTFAYSLNGASFTNFNSSTPLTAGIYHVKITDANGCSYQDINDRTITTPASALGFTETLSDYNGYNISCYGGGNGTASVLATGGNGSNYSGYQYALDNGSFQQDALITGIYAGDHALKVKDARGCVASKTVTFTQTSARLSTILVEKKDVTCYGDATGVLEFTGDGGLPPYSYSLDNATLQDQGRFTQLAANDYTVVIKDKNECDNTATYSIVTINPKIELTTSITDVSCFGGSDGEVSTSIVGGVSPFQYQWTGLTTTSSAATGLAAGSYTVNVTDKVGCRMEASAVIAQPHQALTIGLATVPVCYGRTNGSITVNTNGGTEPYIYSIDNGATFQANPVFLQGVGSYTLTSKDSKGCTITASTEVVLRNDKPEPNFLVATTRSALDTLVIIDVSVPKPDSIYWIFDPQSIVISNDQWSPQLRFMEAGTYFVSMTGYFGGCDYSVTKNMTVNPYDPSVEKEKLPGYKPIQSVTVTPNPSSGEFEVTVTLSKKYNLSIVVYDVLGTAHYQNSWTGVEGIKHTIILSNASSGVYLLRAVTESDAQDVRLLINK